MVTDRRVAGIVLASGTSRRFGPENKLLTPIDGASMVRRTVSAYMQAALDRVIVVVGYDGDAVAAAVDGLGAQIVHNPDYDQGQSRALVRGVEAVEGVVEAAVIGVADQPWLTHETISRLVGTWQSTGAPLVVPRYGGKRGNPVVFARRLFPELRGTTGDTGGRPVLLRHVAEAAWVDIPDSAQGRDIDLPAELPSP